MPGQHDQDVEVNVVCTAGMSLESWVTAYWSCQACSKAWAVDLMYPVTLGEHRA